MRHFMLAIDEGRSTIAGAVSYLDDGERFCGLRLRVVPDRQRVGVGTKLLEEVFKEADRQGRSQVTAQVDPDKHLALNNFLVRNRFKLKSRLSTVEGDLITDVDGKLRAFCQDDLVQIVPLNRALGAEAGRLYAEYIASLPEPLSSRLFFSADAPRFRLTQLLLVDGKVEGLMLVEQDRTRAIIHARVVSERYRGGRASARLVLETLERLRQSGIERLRFQFFDTVRDTLKVSRRLNARTLEQVHFLVFAL